VVIVPKIEKLEILLAFSPDCTKKSALAPYLQLLQQAKVSHENSTLNKIWKNFKNEKNHWS
jgi:hypothetical protein